MKRLYTTYIKYGLPVWTPTQCSSLRSAAPSLLLSRMSCRVNAESAAAYVTHDS